MKSEVDTQIASLQEQVFELSPTEKVTETSNVPDYNERITLLRYALERYTYFDTDEDIPEAVIEAFVEKIVVNENSFDWYLHFSDDDNTPKTCNVEGDKKSHKIELFGASYAPALVEGCSGCHKEGVILDEYPQAVFMIFARISCDLKSIADSNIIVAGDLFRILDQRRSVI